MKQHPVAAFVAGTYLFAWGCWAYLFFTTPPGGMQAGISPLFLAFALAGGLGPTVVALVLSRVIEGRGGARRLLAQFSFTRGRPTWLLAALLLVPCVSLIAMLLQLLMGRHVSPGNVAGRLALGIIWPLFSSLGEEFGWRAFMLPRLREKMKGLRAALLVGCAWGCWHLVADFIGLRSYGWLFLPYFLLAGPLLLTAHSLIMTWIYNRTGNVAFLVLYHFSITSSAILLPTLDLDPVANIVSTGVSVVLFWIIALLITATGGLGGAQRSPSGAYWPRASR
jgi:membrane protease YdiL (CAAX protease family)